MLRRSCLLITLALLACRPSGSDTKAPERASTDEAAPTEVEQPSHLRLPWGAVLYAAPREDAVALRLGVAEDPAAPRPAVAVVGREGAYWKVETLDDEALRELAVPAIEGLDVYALQLYVPIGVGDPIQPIPPGPDTPADARAQALADAREFGAIGLLTSMSVNPPLQSGGTRPLELATDFRVSPSTTVYWADGREAGTVRSEHAFVGPGEVRTSDAGPLRCFAIRVGPDDGGEGELCFAQASVLEVAVVPEHGSPWGEAFATGASDAELWDGEMLGDGYEIGGLGLTGTGFGGGGADVGAGLGEIGTLGHGGGGSGSGYGSGSGDSSTTVKTGKAKVTGSMDADIARRIVRAHANEVRQCWDAPVPGKVDITLEVDDDGNVTSSKASTIDTDIQRCIEQAAASWMFPKSLAGSLALTFDIEMPSP